MIFNKEVFNDLEAHPAPPPVGYVALYAYNGNLWLMLPTGLKRIIGELGSRGIIDINVEDDPEYPLEYLTYVDDIGTHDITVIQKPRGLMYGAKVSYLTGMQFRVTTAVYFLALLYNAPETVIELAEADPDNARIDLIVATDQQTIEVITGTPGANPVKPVLDPITQVEITTITIPAGATNFNGTIERIIVYDENVEWANAAAGVVANFASTYQPYMNTLCIDVDTLTNNDTITFTSPEAIAVTDMQDFSFGFRLKATATKQDGFTVQFYNDAVPVSNEYVFPFNRSTIAWQTILIELGSLAFTGTQYNKIVYRFRKTSGSFTGIYLDYIKLEKGVTQPPVNLNVILTGDVTGYGTLGSPIPTALKSLITGGQFGSATKTLQLTVDTKGRITAIQEVDLTTAAAYVYIAYASASNGTGFTMTFDPALKYVAIKSTTTPIAAPQASDFTGLWAKYIGEDGQPGGDGDDGQSAYVYIAYASNDEGADFTMTFDPLLSYIAIKNTIAPIANPQASDFTGLWKNYAGGSYVWNFNVDTASGDVNTPVNTTDKVYFKRGMAIDLVRTSHATLGNVLEIVYTGLLALPESDLTATGNKLQLTANENQAFGDPVFINAAGKAQLAKGDVITTANVIGLCIDAAVTANNTGTYLIMYGYARNDAWNWSVGADNKIYLSTAGTSGNGLTQTNPGVAPSTENYVTLIVGIPITSKIILFTPQLASVEYKP